MGAQERAPTAQGHQRHLNEDLRDEEPDERGRGGTGCDTVPG